MLQLIGWDWTRSNDGRWKPCGWPWPASAQQELVCFLIVWTRVQRTSGAAAAAAACEERVTGSSLLAETFSGTCQNDQAWTFLPSLSEWGSAHEKLNTSLPFVNTLDFIPCSIHEVVLKLHCVTCREHWNVICDGLLVHTAVISAAMKPLPVVQRVIKFTKMFLKIEWLVNFYKWLFILLFYSFANVKSSILSKTSRTLYFWEVESI